MSIPGMYLHFRCARHEVPGHFVVGKYADYRCEHPGCASAALAYWYRGAQFQTLPVS